MKKNKKKFRFALPAVLTVLSMACERKVQDFSKKDVGGESKTVENQGPGSGAARATEESLNESDRRRFDCLGILPLEASAESGESEILGRPEENGLRGKFLVDEIRYYSELLIGGRSTSSAGSVTQIDGIDESNPKKTSQMKCETSPSSGAGLVAFFTPGTILFPKGTVEKLVSVRQYFFKERYEVLANIRSAMTAADKVFDVAGGEEKTTRSERGQTVLTRYRVFRTADEKLRLRFRQIQTLSREKGSQLRVDVEVFLKRK
jgi:hypothetical protein